MLHLDPGSPAKGIVLKLRLGGNINGAHALERPPGQVRSTDEGRNDGANRLVVTGYDHAGRRFGMIKRILVLCAVLMFLTSCGKSGLNETEGNDVNGHTSPAGSDARYNITVDYATDEILISGTYLDYPVEMYPAYTPVKIIIRTEDVLTDFSYVFFDVGVRDDKFVFTINEVLFSANEFTPDRPIVTNIVFIGELPYYGISFLDKNGERIYLAINQSNRGPEEGPEFLLGPVFLE